MGVTYLTIAATHPLAKSTAEKNAKLRAFIDEFRNTKVAEAEMATMEKKGIATNLFAIYPPTNEKNPNLDSQFCVNGIWYRDSNGSSWV